MKFAYADPPYIGCGHLYPEKTEVNHDVLIEQLIEEYTDGWALSASSPSLYLISSMLENRGFHQIDGDYRVMSWVKPFAIFKPGVGLAYSWEPVFIMGGRKITRQEPTVKDHHIANITLKKGLTGTKPESFCEWVCRALNVQPGDALYDLFPGTGVMSRVARPILQAEGLSA